MDQQIRALALRDGRYSPQAFEFLFDALERAILLAGKNEALGPERHVTGREVLTGMRDLAAELFGPLAAQVWRSWGIRSTLDWGRIVFLLVDEGLLNRRDDDSIEEFRDGFDFDEAFVRDYHPAVPGDPEDLDVGGI